jgi:hypothetical protein
MTTNNSRCKLPKLKAGRIVLYTGVSYEKHKQCGVRLFFEITGASSESSPNPSEGGEFSPLFLFPSLVGRGWGEVENGYTGEHLTPVPSPKGEGGTEKILQTKTKY